MTEHRGHRIQIVGVFAESVIVRNRFWLRVNHEFVGIAAARLAIEGCAPLAEYAFQFFLWHGRDLLDGFYAEGAKRAFRDFADAGNFSYWKHGKKSLLAVRR